MDPLHIVIDQEPVDVLISRVAPLLTILGFLLVYWQLRVSAETYRLAAQDSAVQNRWKKAEYIAEQVSQFFADPVVRKTIHLLDYHYRLIEARSGPAARVEILYAREDPDLTMAAAQDDRMKTCCEDARTVVLTRALEDQTRDFTGYESDTRDEFDQFLNRFGRFERLIAAGLFDYDEVEVHLKYILDLLLGRQDHASRPLAETIRKYVRKYQFDAADKLIERRIEAARPARRVGYFGSVSAPPDVRPRA
jgi:hypothetical protein